MLVRLARGVLHVRLVAFYVAAMAIQRRASQQRRREKKS